MPATAAAASPAGRGAFLTVRDAATNMIKDLDLGDATRVCQTASFAAGGGQRALAWVNFVCQIPGNLGGNHDISIVPLYSADGGTTWTWMNPHPSIRTNPTSAAIFDTVSSFGSVPLKAGGEYLFASEVKDRFGSGFSSSSCYCRTLVEIVAE